MAVFFAVTTLVPNYSVLLPFLGPVKLKYIAIFYLVLDIISIPNGNPGGHIAHLGGALYGFAYIKAYQSGTDWSRPFNNLIERIKDFFSSRKKPKVRVVHRRPLKDEDYNAKKKSAQEEVDRILDKIKDSGYESLSKEEKDTLFRASKDI